MPWLNKIKIHKIIYFSLFFSAEKAERTASKMISEERMQGHIDQIDSTVHFESRQVLQTWDDQIQSLCFQVKTFLNLLFGPFSLASVSVRRAVKTLKSYFIQGAVHKLH